MRCYDVVRWAWTAGLAVAAAACSGTKPPARSGADSAAQGAERIAAAPIRVDSLRPDSLLALARARGFDTLRGHTDAQALMDANRAPGPLAEIEPSADGFRATRAMLAAGFVVARIVNRDTLPYAAVNLAARDTVYWFVDSTASGWRSTYVSSRAGARPLVRPMTFEEHADQHHLEPSARWLVGGAGGLTTLQAGTTGGTTPWATCTPYGCCKG